MKEKRTASKMVRLPLELHEQLVREAAFCRSNGVSMSLQNYVERLLTGKETRAILEARKK
jgi:hypothetical protein